MASLTYYAKSVFASSYGKDKPDFFIWHPKGLPTSEKKLLFKIDLFILTYGCLAYFTKWLDQANLSNAYVSGMREDLQMYGNQYNLASTCFSVGQILGPIPANILLTWIPPRFLLPGLELIWAGLTIGTYAVKDVNQVRDSRTWTYLDSGQTGRKLMNVSIAIPHSLLRRLPRGFHLRRHPIRPRIMVQEDRTGQTNRHFRLRRLRRHHDLGIPAKRRAGRP